MPQRSLHMVVFFDFQDTSLDLPLQLTWSGLDRRRRLGYIVEMPVAQISYSSTSRHQGHWRSSSWGHIGLPVEVQIVKIGTTGNLKTCTVYYKKWLPEYLIVNHHKSLFLLLGMITHFWCYHFKWSSVRVDMLVCIHADWILIINRTRIFWLMKLSYY